MARLLTESLSNWLAGDMGQSLDLPPVCAGGAPANMRDWLERRETIRAAWRGIMGQPEYETYARSDALLETFAAPTFIGRVYRQQTGPDAFQTAVVLEPKQDRLNPRPGAVVPFYHPDLMMGFDLSKKAPIMENMHMHFGRHLVEQGFVVVCCEAFPYNTVPDPQSAEPFAWWKTAACKLLADHPRWTGIGKLTADVMRAVDLLMLQPRIDSSRIAAVGHSLGGKMAFTAGALDERIKAVIGSDFGLGWDFTNWDAPWYYGAQVRRPDFQWGNHHLLALMAPHPFLLLAGRDDRTESRQYLAAARSVYALYGRSDGVGMIHHATGHRPPPEVVHTAYRWLSE